MALLIIVMKCFIYLAPQKMAQTLFFLIPDNNYPSDLFGYWHLSDDLMVFGKFRTFTPNAGPDPLKIAKYSFIPNNPVPSFTGRWGIKFDGTTDTALLVTSIE